MRHEFLPFTADLHEHIWKNLAKPSCILFAHEGQKKAFIASYQDDVHLYDHVLLTAEEFLDSQLCIETPIISPDQRWLMIAKSINAAQRKELSISSHRAAWSFARRVYALWMATWESDKALNEKDDCWHDWQRPWIKISSEIRSNYQHNLLAMGYTDKIFLKIKDVFPENLVGRRLILANLPLVRPHLLRLFSLWSPGQVMALHHGPTGWFDSASGDLRPLSEWVNDERAIRTLHVVEISVGHESQERQILSSMKPVNVVDPRQRPLWLNPRTVSMSRTSLFQFWSTWLSVFQKGHADRISLAELRTLLFNKAFVCVYGLTDDVVQRFWKAANDGIRWVRLRDWASKRLIDDFKAFERFDVNVWGNVIAHLPDSLWTEPGVDEIRYQFGSVWESLKLSYMDGLVPAEAVLEYLVDRLSRRSVKVVDTSELISRQPKDCLNVVASERYFTGVMEGLIPASVEPPWLLMPKQVEGWGLPSPTMIQSADAYAWAQAILTSKKATVLVYHDGQNFRPPSLWNWLRAGLPVFPVTDSIPSIVGVNSSHHETAIVEEALPLVSGLPLKLKDFEINHLSYSAYNTWTNCPYWYALSKGYRLNISNPNELGLVPPTFMGQLAHDWLEVFMADVAANLSRWNKYTSEILLKMARQVWVPKSNRWPIDLEGVLVEKVVLPDLVDMSKGLVLCIDQQVGFSNITKIFLEEAEDQVLSNADGISLCGRADLRIETTTGDVWVIDYKSGSDNDALQLNWYAALYYGHIHPSQIKLAFYLIPDRKFKMVKTQLEKIDEVGAQWQKALSATQQERTETSSHCQYCPFGELCQK